MTTSSNDAKKDLLNAILAMDHIIWVMMQELPALAALAATGANDNMPTRRKLAA